MKTHRARHPRGPRVLPFILLAFLLVRVFIKATVREDRAPFFPNQTATDEKKFNVFFTIVVYLFGYFLFIPMLIVILLD